MPLSEKLLAHIDAKSDELAENSTGETVNYAKPKELSTGETILAGVRGVGLLPAQIPRYVGALGYGAAKLGQGVASAFGKYPNAASGWLGGQAESTWQAGDIGSRSMEGRLYSDFGEKSEQARSVGRSSADFAATTFIPVPGIGVAGAAGEKLAAAGISKLPLIGAGGKLAPAGSFLAKSAGTAAGGSVAGAQSAVTSPLLSGRLVGTDESGQFSLGRAGKEVIKGATFGAALGAATPAASLIAKPVLGAVGRGAAKVEELGRSAYNRAAVSAAGENARMVSPVPALGKYFGPEAEARAGQSFGKKGDGMKVDVGGGIGTAEDAAQTAALAQEIAAARDPLRKVTPEAQRMAQVAQAFQLPKVRSFQQMEANHRTIVDGIDTVGQVIGKEVPADTVQALEGVRKAKEKLMPVITEANKRVTGRVSEAEAVNVADGILATPEIDAELLAQGISGDAVKGWAKQLAGRSQEDLQRVKNSLANSVSGKKVGQYQGATEDALKLRVVSQLMDDRVVAALGQSNKPVSQQLAKLNAFEKHLAGVASVDLRKADASLSVILANALAHGDLGAAKSGLWKAGWAKAAGMLDKVRGKNNLISSVYEDVYKTGAPTGAYKLAGSEGFGKNAQPAQALGKTVPADKAFAGTAKFRKTQAAQDAAEASASLRSPGAKKGNIGGGAGGQYDDAGNMVMDAEGKSADRSYAIRKKALDEATPALGKKDGSYDLAVDKMRSMSPTALADQRKFKLDRINELMAGGNTLTGDKLAEYDRLIKELQDLNPSRLSKAPVEGFRAMEAHKTRKELVDRASELVSQGNLSGKDLEEYDGIINRLRKMSGKNQKAPFGKK